MTEKKKPTFGALGNPYGASVPDEVADFFGAEAPAAEPAVQWNEDREAAARELAAKEAAARELAAKEAAAREMAAQEAAARELAAKEVVAREAAATRATSEKSVLANHPTVAGRTAAEEPKSLAQTIRSHWDSLIDSLGIGGRAKAERGTLGEAAAEKSPVLSDPPSRTAATGSSAVGGPKGRSGALGSEPVVGESRVAKTERVARGTTPAKAESAAPPQEIPADAFGLGIFSAPTAARQNPLDDLFAAGSSTAAEPDAEADALGQDEYEAGVGRALSAAESPGSEGSDGRRRRRRRGGRGGGAGREAEDAEVTPSVVDSRRRVPGRSEPVLPVADEDEVEDEDQIEFEVVDLGGGDLSGFWDDSAEAVPKLRHRPTPAPAADVEPARRPDPGAGRAGAGRSSAGRSGARPVPARDYEEDLEPEVPRRGGRGGSGRSAPPQPAESVRPARPARDIPARDIPARDIPARDLAARELPPRERVAREPVGGSGRGGEETVPGGNRGRQRRAKPSRDVEPDMDMDMDLPVERPADRAVAGGGRRSSAGRRPAPPVPSRADDDDDGYTVDNSWSPDDPRDEGAPKRRPVPAWRRVVDHIVDRNLSNRRGSDGNRRRGGGAGGRGSHASVAAQPRAPRNQVPTYLDEPSDISDADPFDAPESARGRAPRRGRPMEDERGFAGRGPESDAGPSRGRRPVDRDDYPDDRPRGRRRY